MSKILPTSRFKLINPKEFDLNKCTSNSSKLCVLEVDLEFPKELHELHNNCPLASGKIKIKWEILCEYKLKIDTIFLLATLKNLCLTFLIKKSMWFIMRTYNFTSD